MDHENNVFNNDQNNEQNEEENNEEESQNNDDNNNINDEALNITTNASIAEEYYTIDNEVGSDS